MDALLERPSDCFVHEARRVERVAELHELASRDTLRWEKMWSELVEAGVITGLRTNLGIDAFSACLLNWSSGLSGGGSNAGTTATAPTATTFTTDGKNFAANSLVGMMIATTSGANRIGIIQSNTSATNSVLTIDRWYDPASSPANRGVAAASTPTAGAWILMPGNAPAAYMGLTANTSGPAATDTVLTGEITTVGGGLIRQLATYAHSAASAGAGTTTLTKTFTGNGTDSYPVVVHKIGVFQGVEAASILIFATNLNADATLAVSGDQVAITETVTL